METKIITAEWNPGKLLLETALTGNISIEDIDLALFFYAALNPPALGIKFNIRKQETFIYTDR